MMRWLMGIWNLHFSIRGDEWTVHVGFGWIAVALLIAMVFWQTP